MIITALMFSKLFYCLTVWVGDTMKNREIAKGTEFCYVDHNGYTKFKHIMRYLKDLLWLLVAMQLEVRDIIIII